VIAVFLTEIMWEVSYSLLKLVIACTITC